MPQGWGARSAPSPTAPALTEGPRRARCGEPAWHRRDRARRAEARKLLRVASLRLADHHGTAPAGGMTRWSRRTDKLRNDGVSSRTAGNGPCPNLRDAGGCTRPNCPHTHDLPSTGAGGAGNGGRKGQPGPCFAFRDSGTCPRGASCPFLHLRSFRTAPKVCADSKTNLK